MPKVTAAPTRLPATWLIADDDLLRMIAEAARCRALAGRGWQAQWSAGALATPLARVILEHI